MEGFGGWVESVLWVYGVGVCCHGGRGIVDGILGCVKIYSGIWGEQEDVFKVL